MFDLHIFTNCTDVIYRRRTIFNTYNSFCNTFGVIKPTVWVDPHPQTRFADKYIKQIKNLIDCNIEITSSLSDGYLKALSKPAQYHFMLEHDWVFNQEFITDSLDDICKEMAESKIPHIRFNQYKNGPYDHSGWTCSQAFDEKVGKYIKYCTTRGASNNPHIVYMPEYQKLQPLIRLDQGSHGIEDRLGDLDCNLAIYGAWDLPPTISHTNGRWDGK